MWTERNPYAVPRFRFPVILRPGEDGWLVVECPVIEGCISQGRTREEALVNIREAIQCCLEKGPLPKFELTLTEVEVG